MSEDYDYDQCKATLEPQWPENIGEVRCVLHRGHKSHHLVYSSEFDVTVKWKGQMATVWRTGLGEIGPPRGEHQTW